MLNNHKVVLNKADGEPAFGYPVPIAELVPLVERQGRSPAIDYEGISEHRSLGHMLRADEPAAAADAGSRAKFALLGPGTYVAYKAPVPEGPKSIVVGRIVENKTAESTMKVSRLKGCLLYTSPSPRDGLLSRMPSSA